MALAPIPSCMLKDRLIVVEASAVDRYQSNTSQNTYTINNVHLQESTDVIKGADNTEVQLRGILFIDSKKSQPSQDWEQRLHSSLTAGNTLKAIVQDPITYAIKGQFTVLDLVVVPDVPANRTHHWEMLLT